MAYSTLQDVIDDIGLKIIENNNNEIQGQQLQDILLGICQFIQPTLIADLLVRLGAGNSVGGADNGELFPAGTTLEAVLRDILTKGVHPTYIPPTLSLSSSIALLLYESGSVISPVLNSIFTQNDAGGLVTRSLKRNGTTISSTFPFTDTARTIADGDTAYQATAVYGQGPLKNNNLGAPDSVGQIPAGSINSNIITYTGYRKMFAGTPSSAVTTSNGVRALTTFLLNPVVGSELLITIPEGATRVVFAYPATLPDPSSVKYIELSHSEVKDLFTKTTVNVEGANAYTAISYKVFSFTPIEPYQAAVTYKVII